MAGIFTKSKVFSRLRSITAALENTTQFGQLQPCQLSSRSLHLSRASTQPAHDAQFDDAKARMNSLKEDPGNDVKLKIYALFKQATIGKNTTPKPGMMNMVGKVKWTAWADLGDMSQDDAQKAYIAIVDELAAAEAGEVEDAGPGKQYEGLKITRENKVFRIMLNRPKKKNAITYEMYEAIGEALKEAAADKNTSIAVITGAGDYYCSGNDLSNFANVTPEMIPKMASDAKDVLRRYVNAYIDFPKPLIALINGPAVGVSVTVLGLCDAVYSTDKATFQTPFSALGQSPEACSSYTFPKLMGYAKANELLLFNKKITAEQAVERNLVSAVIPDAQFAAETDKIIQLYASFPPQSMSKSKVLNRDAERAVLKKVNDAECELLEERWQSQECMNAIMAFFTKKK